MATIKIRIDDVDYTTADDDQEAASLLRLAHREPRTHDLFVVDEHGVETHIKDRQIVDLHGGERFRTRHKVHFTMDGESHSSWDDDQTAAALLRLAGVDPATYDLARVSGGPAGPGGTHNGGGTPEMFADDQLVTIHNGDQFVTAKHAGPVA